MSQNDKAERPGLAKRIKKWALRILIAGASCFLLLVIFIACVLLYYSAGLPTFDSLADYSPPQVTRMYDSQGRVVAELFDERRTVVKFDEIPEHVRSAFLAAEDADFYRHPGLDFAGMLRALWANLKAGRVVQGGSTITQQVIKTFILGPERSYSRKIKEVLLALRLETNLTKDEIFSLYLNQIFFGHHNYGVQEASRFFFGKPVQELTLAQAAVLAALPKSPARYSPIKHPDRALRRRNWVLDQMLSNKMISEEEAARAKQEELAAVGKSANFFELAPYYAEHCRRMLEEILGRELLYQGGLRVDLAVDLDLQGAAREAMQSGLRKVDRRQGFRGPLDHISTEVLAALHEKYDSQVKNGTIWTLTGVRNESKPKKWSARWIPLSEGIRIVVPVIALEGKGKAAIAKLDLGSRRAELRLKQAKWARKFSPVARTPAPTAVTDLFKAGDLVEILVTDFDSSKDRVKIRLSQPPLVQGALVAIEPGTRNVRAMVGGSDFRRSPLIRAVQSRRQPGSAFKPVVYAAAVQSREYTPTTIMMDTPEVYYSSLRGSTYKPRNFERVFVGPVSLRYALAHSINTIAVKITSDLGPENVISMARALGIETELKSNLSLALGSSEVTPLELVNAYTTLAAGGIAATPVFITSVTGPDGQPVKLRERKEPYQAIGAAEAFVMTSLLKSVIEDGTGKKAKRLNRSLVGKTGTANQQRDGWFVGYSPDLACGVWVGFDDHSRMGSSWAQGAGTALPIWIGFMEAALKDRPRSDFKAPDGAVFVRVDPENGLLAPPKFVGARFEVFVEGTEPRSLSSRTSASASSKPGTSPGRTTTYGAVPGDRLPEGLFR